MPFCVRVYLLALHWTRLKMTLQTGIFPVISGEKVVPCYTVQKNIILHFLPGCTLYFHLYRGEYNLTFLTVYRRTSQLFSLTKKIYDDQTCYSLWLYFIHGWGANPRANAATIPPNIPARSDQAGYRLAVGGEAAGGRERVRGGRGGEDGLQIFLYL